MPRAMSLVVHPENGQLSFKGPYTEQCIEFLYLSNPTESSIAYKVKTTAPLRYHVKPAIGIIAPKGEATVTIVFDLLGKDKPPNFQQSKHKFLLEAALVSTLMDTDVTKIISHARSQGELMESVFLCAFDEAALQVALNPLKKSPIAGTNGNPSNVATLGDGPTGISTIIDDADGLLKLLIFALAVFFFGYLYHAAFIGNNPADTK